MSPGVPGLHSPEQGAVRVDALRVRATKAPLKICRQRSRGDNHWADGSHSHPGTWRRQLGMGFEQPHARRGARARRTRRQRRQQAQQLAPLVAAPSFSDVTRSVLPAWLQRLPSREALLAGSTCQPNARSMKRPTEAAKTAAPTTTRPNFTRGVLNWVAIPSTKRPIVKMTLTTV